MGMFRQHQKRRLPNGNRLFLLINNRLTDSYNAILEYHFHFPFVQHKEIDHNN